MPPSMPPTIGVSGKRLFGLPRFDFRCGPSNSAPADATGAWEGACIHAFVDRRAAQARLAFNFGAAEQGAERAGFGHDCLLSNGHEVRGELRERGWMVTPALSAGRLTKCRPLSMIALAARKGAGDDEGDGQHDGDDDQHARGCAGEIDAAAGNDGRLAGLAGAADGVEGGSRAAGHQSIPSAVL